MDIKKSTVSVLSYLTGVTLLKKCVLKTQEIVTDKTARAGLSSIQAATALLSQKRIHRTETFEEACQRQNIGSADLSQIESNLEASAKLFRWLAWLTVAGAAMSFLAVDSLYWYALYVIAGGAIAGLLAVYALRDTFRLWQTRRRDLATFSDFLADGGILNALAG